MYRKNLMKLLKFRMINKKNAKNSKIFKSIFKKIELNKKHSKYIKKLSKIVVFKYSSFLINNYLIKKKEYLTIYKIDIKLKK